MLIVNILIKHLLNILKDFMNRLKIITSTIIAIITATIVATVTTVATTIVIVTAT